MLNNTYRYDANHPMCTGTMNTVFHRILNAFTLNTKIVYEQGQRDSRPTPLFKHLLKVLLKLFLLKLVIRKLVNKESNW